MTTLLKRSVERKFIRTSRTLNQKIREIGKVSRLPTNTSKNRGKMKNDPLKCQKKSKQLPFLPIKIPSIKEILSFIITLTCFLLKWAQWVQYLQFTHIILRLISTPISNLVMVIQWQWCLLWRCLTILILLTPLIPQLLLKFHLICSIKCILLLLQWVNNINLNQKRWIIRFWTNLWCKIIVLTKTIIQLCKTSRALFKILSLSIHPQTNLILTPTKIYIISLSKSIIKILSNQFPILIPISILVIIKIIKIIIKFNKKQRRLCLHHHKKKDKCWPSLQKIRRKIFWNN